MKNTSNSNAHNNIYNITINKGKFKAEIELEFLDEAVEVAYSIYYDGLEVKADNISTDCIPRAIDSVIDEIDTLENLENILK